MSLVELRQIATFRQTMQTVKLEETLGAITAAASVRIVSRGFKSLLATRHLPFLRAVTEVTRNVILNLTPEILVTLKAEMEAVSSLHILSPFHHLFHIVSERVVIVSVRECCDCD